MVEGRRRSKSSSSSSSSDNESKQYSDEKQQRGRQGYAQNPSGPSMPVAHSMPQGFPSFPSAEGGETRGLQPPPYPPPYSGPPPLAPPSSGYRIPLTTEAPFPPVHLTLQAPFTDADGRSPVYFGSALFPNAVHPCKVAPHLTPPCRVPYGGTETEHRGRYDLLPFTPETMELVPASGGRLPPGRRPVEGGYEEGGQKLYHAVAVINGLRVPGKVGEHLYGCNAPFGGQEHIITEYAVLCWRH